MRFIYFFLIFFISFTFSKAFAQQYTFLGVLKIDNKSQQSLSYSIMFTEENGKIKGYSITDMAGRHETKNKIEGFYNSKTGMLSFKESSIVYTKSTVSKGLFCFVNFNGKIGRKHNMSYLNGKFTGLRDNSTPCVNGQIELIGNKDLEALIAKANKKIQNSKLIKNEEKIDLNHTIDSLKGQYVNSNENLNVFVNDVEQVKIRIWDNANEDGDRINLYLNEQLILKDYEVVNQKKEITLNIMAEKNVLKIVALNQGSQGLNTVMMTIDGEDIKFQSNLKTNEYSTITFYKKK